jgi:hypothetical protein
VRGRLHENSTFHTWCGSTVRVAREIDHWFGIQITDMQAERPRRVLIRAIVNCSTAFRTSWKARRLWLTFTAECRLMRRGLNKRPYMMTAIKR